MNEKKKKKWRPFNAVVPSSELLKRENNFQFPTLSKDEINEFEEILKRSLYTHSKVKVSYVENGSIKLLIDYVIRLDSIRKDIIFKTRKINFRQIVKVEN